MKWKRKFQLALLILLILVCLARIASPPRNKEEVSYNISVIVRGNMDMSWSNLKRGAEDAAADLNVNVRFVASLEGNTAEEQLELLEKEMEGSDAVLISPVNRILMKDPILKLSKNKTPLLMFESGISGENEIPLLCCDNEQMGRDMAQAMINHGNIREKIIIFSGNGICSSVTERQKGFLSVMEETDNQCMIVSAGSFQPEAISEILTVEEPDAVIALDDRIVENLTKAGRIYRQENTGKKLQIYGIGCSSEILKSLENQELVNIAAQDDYAIGYLGVQESVALIQGKEVQGNEDIRYIITNSSHMYDDVDERLLFPFVR
ncbi:MAG: substrate-binding domain-containing protein [Dorea sp.]|nr:substrate-binding domain-containing protein [Dorea sp.]